MSRNPGHFGIGRCLVTAVALALVVAACNPRVDVRGRVPNPDALAEIRVGEQTREDVAELLGSPSTIGTFDDQRWFYVTRRTETYAFLEPEVVLQDVVVIEFDEAGFVSSVGAVDLADAREIDPVDDETPTRGRELGLLEQLLGNIGTPAGLPGSN